MWPMLALLCLIAAAPAARADEQRKESEAASAKEKQEEESALEQMLGPEDDLDDPPQPASPAAPLVGPARTERGAPSPPNRKAAQKSGRTGEIAGALGFGTSQPTPENPRQRALANLIRGSLYLGEAFTLDASVLLTLEGGAPPPVGSPFQASYGGAVALASVGFDWEASDHWTLGARVEGSPASEQYSATTVQYQATKLTAFETVDALLKARNSSLGGALSVSWDSAGDSAFESAVLGSVTVTDLSSDERLTQVAGRDGRVVSAADLRTFCRNTPTKCSKSLRAVLSDQQFSIAQTRLMGSYTATIADDTDLTLGGEYYFYSDDPTQLGFFSVATAGRLTSLGGGVPIAPLQWTLRPEVAHRWGAFSARLWVQGGRYVEGAGEGTAAIGLKLQYKFTRAFWMSLVGTGQRDTDIDGNVSRLGVVALGAAYKF